MRRYLALCAIGWAIAAGPAAADPQGLRTVSGRPEALFADKSPEDVSGLLASRCADKGREIVSSTPSEVICKGRLGFGASLVAALAMGSDGATSPEAFWRFVIFKTGAGTRVQASIYIENHSAFGQERRIDITNGKTMAETQQALFDLGGTSPSETPAAPLPSDSKP